MSEFQKDVGVDKPGIVGARWWQQSLVAEQGAVNRRKFLVGLAIAGGAVVTIGAGIASIGSDRVSTSLASRDALEMQRQFGWDFGARGVPLVFDGVAEAPFDRGNLPALAGTITPAAPNLKHHVATLVESLFARPTAFLPDPADGLPRPDGAPFRMLAEVIMPVVTPAMTSAYAIGEALARLLGGRKDVAVLVDLPGPEAVALAAGAAAGLEPVLLLDNWPHPRGVVPSHMALAALAYYQPRFASTRAARGPAAPLFVLDRARLAAYSEESDRFDNRYYARMPPLDMLARDGIRGLLYVVASPAALPEPADLNAALAARAPVEARAIALTDFVRGDAGMDYPAFASDYSFAAEAEKPAAPAAPGATKDYRFVASPTPAPRPANLGKVAVVVTATGLILSAALDRRGSMNRFSGGWGG